MTRFTSIANAEDITSGSMKQITFEGTEVIVANVGGEFFVLGSKCTCISHFAGHRHHAFDNSLAEGELTGSTVTCPIHGTIYDVRDGAPVRGPGEAPVSTYEVQNHNGDLRVATMTNAERCFWNAA